MTNESFFALAIMALVALFFGFVFAFSGYRFFLVLLPIWGFFYGFGVGAHTIQALLGDAFLAQQQDLMAAIQRLRARAQSTGQLKSTAEQKVIVEPAASPATAPPPPPAGAPPAAPPSTARICSNCCMKCNTWTAPPWPSHCSWSRCCGR